MSPLVISAILGLFVNTLPADGKHSILNSENFLQPIQRQLSKILKIFLKHLLEFLNFPQALNILKKEMIRIACVFPKLETAKNVVS